MGMQFAAVHESVDGTERTCRTYSSDVRCWLDCVAKVENRTTPKISQKLIFGLLCNSIAFQSRQEGPWSILEEAIRSLTSPRVKRISGSKNFRSTPQKDFCNNIAVKRKTFLGRVFPV